MPWYWTDDVAPVLVATGAIDLAVASRLAATPVAYRSEQVTIEAAAAELLDDGEIPLAA